MRVRPFASLPHHVMGSMSYRRSEFDPVLWWGRKETKTLPRQSPMRDGDRIILSGTRTLADVPPNVPDCVGVIYPLGEVSGRLHLIKLGPRTAERMRRDARVSERLDRFTRSREERAAALQPAPTTAPPPPLRLVRSDQDRSASTPSTRTVRPSTRTRPSATHRKA